jgi:hypothetical protein
VITASIIGLAREEQSGKLGPATRDSPARKRPMAPRPELDLPS